MGWRFRRSIKILPGVKINFNKKSVGITVGKKGAHYTVNSKGKHTASVGIPGTGLYYTQSASTSEKKGSNSKGTIEKNAKTSGMKTGCLAVLLVFVLCIVISGIMTDWGKKASESSSTLEETLACEESEGIKESVPDPVIMYASTTLNVRSGPGTEYDIIGSLNPGDEVEVIGQDNGWANIEYASAAFVSLSYLSKNPPETSAEPSEPMVWISHTGKKYHSSPYCSNMKGPSQVSLSEAQKRGKTPCSKCY